MQIFGVFLATNLTILSPVAKNLWPKQNSTKLLENSPWNQPGFQGGQLGRNEIKDVAGEPLTLHRYPPDENEKIGLKKKHRSLKIGV